MADKLINGDYEKGENGLSQCEYTEELMQNIMLLLSAERGKFYPDKDFGSRIKEQETVSAANALAFARQALNTLDGVYVKSARYENGNLYLTIRINDEEREVNASFE